MSENPVLNRKNYPQAAARPPVRLLHLGLGNFFRAHQAFFTAHAPDASQWGYAAFTGRRPDMARALAPQDGLYTLVVQSATGNKCEVIDSISAVHSAGDWSALLDYFRSPALSVITTTITEAGYRRAEGGGLDKNAADIAQDLAALRTNLLAEVSCVPARFVAGFAARRQANASGAPLTVLPCDNLPGNGQALRKVVEEAAYEVDATLVEWMNENVSWATSMVDRITPATTEDQIRCAFEFHGLADASPVPTEDFAEWVIAGDFPAGRPAWDLAGATICADVEPFEQRKLWMLNGSHSLLAYAGPILGHESVFEAINDERLATWVKQWWQVAGPYLSVPFESYILALQERFKNPAIRHLLAQIAHDGSQKIPVRILPVLSKERAKGNLPDGAIRPLAAWVAHLRGAGAPIVDASGDQAVRAACNAPDLPSAVSAVLAVVWPQLADDQDLAARAGQLAQELLDEA